MTSFPRTISIWWRACLLRLDLLLPAKVPLWIRLLFLPGWFMPRRDLSEGERLRLWCEAMGPVFVKFGQALSTRPDLLGPEMGAELAKLQDSVPPFGTEVFRDLLEQGLGSPVEGLFRSFEQEPLASASLAQVHGAVLHNGDSVVIKIIRPGIERVIQRDLKLLGVLAAIINRMGADGRRLHAPEVISDYHHIIHNELNLCWEAANSQKLRDNFIDNPVNYTPKVYWDYVRPNILVSERIDGIPVTDAQAIADQGIDLKQLAEIGVGIFFTQVFEHNFFHADMHPGNIFVSKTHIANPQYICVDCAIVGSLSDTERYYLATMLLSVFRRDYGRVASLQIEAGWVASDTPVNLLEGEIRTVCEPIFSRPLEEISFATIMINLFKTARRFDLQMMPSLFLLEKTIVNIEGLGRQLYPKLDLWATLAPLFEKLSRERYAPRTLGNKVREQGPEWLEQCAELPDLLLGALRKMNDSPAGHSIGNHPGAGRKSAGVLALLGAAALGVLLGLALPELPTEQHLRNLSLATMGLLGIYLLVRR